MTPKSSPATPLRQLPPVQASTPAAPVASNREPTATGAAELRQRTDDSKPFECPRRYLSFVRQRTDESEPFECPQPITCQFPRCDCDKPLPEYLSFVRDYDREKRAQQAARLAEFRMHHDRPFHLAPRAPFATFVDMLLNRQRRVSEVQADYDDEQELVGR